MAEPDDFQDRLFNDAVHWLNAQASSHRAMMESRPRRRHAVIIKQTMTVLRDALAEGSFETLLRLESELQEQELMRYSQESRMMASIEKTREDLAEGMRDYRQLKEDPAGYYARGYRKRDRTGANQEFPLDTMRKALRSQATRVGNFAKNPMLSAEEKEFHLLRVSLLKRTEKLYEELQARVLAAYCDESRE